MVALIHEGLVRHDTDHPVFHGSYDWHSSVHAHWAALRASREFGHTSHQTHLLNRLTGHRFRRELDALLTDDTFEMPYGRAWLLLLCRELEREYGVDSGPATERVASTLGNWLYSKPLKADTGEYQNHSWAVLQLYKWYVHRGADEQAKQLQRRVSVELVTGGLTPQQDVDRAEFFSRWGMQALTIGHVLGVDALRHWLSTWPVEVPTPIVAYRSVHHLGLNASRAWALHMVGEVAPTGGWRKAYLHHVRASVSLLPSHGEDYVAFGHWVPQFVVYAWLLDAARHG